MKILDKTKAKYIRNEYICHFIDTNSEYYVSRILKCEKFSDGVCYTGYMWDCLKVKSVMLEKECLEYLKNKKFYVLWDIHSRDRILIPNYWKYPKEAVLQMEFKEFLIKRQTLPEDIYIIDESFQWSIILTHEEIEGQRFCLFSSVL